MRAVDVATTRAGIAGLQVGLQLRKTTQLGLTHFILSGSFQESRHPNLPTALLRQFDQFNQVTARITLRQAGLFGRAVTGF
jgi:hypothetical protein